MRRVVLLAALLAVVLLLPILHASPAYTVTLTVTGADGSPLASATVEVYYQDGTRVASGATDSSGRYQFDVTSNGTYLVVVSKAYYVLDHFAVNGNNVAKSIDLTTGYHKLNVTSTPVIAGFNVTLAAVSGVTYGGASTNATIFIPAGEGVTVALPKEIRQLIFKYTLEKIVYDSTETTQNSVTLTMDADKVVTAHYTRGFAITLENWMIAVLIVIIAVAIAVVWRAGAKTAKDMVEEYRERSRKFVRRK